jgi:dCMP deaminase
MIRPSFDDRMLIVAAAVSLGGDCTRRQVGAVITDTRRRVVITGYNGSPPGGPSCLAGACPRGQHYLIPRRLRLDASTAAQCACGARWPCPLAAGPGSSYDTGPGTCIALHAEMNCAIYADPLRLPGATIYVTHEPCDGCARVIAGSGITRTVWGPPSAGAVIMALELMDGLGP